MLLYVKGLKFCLLWDLSVWWLEFGFTLNISEHLHNLHLAHLKEKAPNLLETSYSAVLKPVGPQVTSANPTQVVINSS